MNVWNNIYYNFGTRREGVPASDCEHIRRGENPSHILEKLFLKTTSASKIFAPKQIHGNDIHVFSKISESYHSSIEADGIITGTADVCLAILTADCLPIFLFDPKKEVIGVFHAGWRGTVKKIVKKGVHIMEKYFGVTPPDIFAALGPCIGNCCFEIGAEVKDEISEARMENEISPYGDKWTFDLAKANRSQLMSAGCNNIFSSNLCTHCKKELFYSYRRGRDRERMVNIIYSKRPYT